MVVPPEGILSQSALDGRSLASDPRDAASGVAVVHLYVSFEDLEVLCSGEAGLDQDQFGRGLVGSSDSLPG